MLMTRFSPRLLALGPFALGLVVCVGCGQNSDVANQAAPNQPSAQATAATAKGQPADRSAGQPSGSASHHGPSPQEVVSQFLDLVRRGGDSPAAGELLTVKAQAELARIGRSVQPIGSPDAHFDVTRSESVPGEDQSVLVHSVWSEPNRDGTRAKFQVVWAVELEEHGWRISGLAMELEPGAEPTIIDFENGNLMAQLLESPEPEKNPASDGGDALQAVAPASSVTR